MTKYEPGLDIPHINKGSFYGHLSTSVWTSWWIRSSELEVLATIDSASSLHVYEYDKDSNTLLTDSILVVKIPFCFELSTTFDRFVLSAHSGLTTIVDYTKRLDKLIYKDLENNMVEIESWKNEAL